MARYRKIDPGIWNDAKFRTMSQDARYLFLFILTHPHMTALGAMRATIGGLADELGWDRERLSARLSESLDARFVEYDGKACCLVARSFPKYNPPESPNVVRGWVKFLDFIPECDLKTLQLQRLKALAEALGVGFAKAFAEGCGQALPNHEHEHEHNSPPVVPLPGAEKVDESNTTKAKAVSDADVEAVYACYPKKVGGQAALRAVRKALETNGMTAEYLIPRVKAFAESVAGKVGTDQARYIPKPSTWFGQQRWKDEGCQKPDKNRHCKRCHTIMTLDFDYRDEMVPGKKGKTHVVGHRVWICASCGFRERIGMPDVSTVADQCA